MLNNVVDQSPVFGPHIAADGTDADGTAAPDGTESPDGDEEGGQSGELPFGLLRCDPDVSRLAADPSFYRDEPIYVMEHFDEADAYDRPITRDRVAMPPIAELVAQFERVWWELQPGDALVWFHRVLHAAPVNALDRPRRSIAYLWLGDDARYDASPGRCDPDLWDDTIPDGAPFHSDRFPLVR